MTPDLDYNLDAHTRLEAINYNSMRIGEIAIVGPSNRTKAEFIKSACDELVFDTEKLIFGRLPINDQLMLHLYGLDYRDSDNNPSWDLVSRKLLGYVVLFDWKDQNALNEVKEAVDMLNARYQIPVIIAANVGDEEGAIPASVMNVDFKLSHQSDFTFCNTNADESVRQALVLLVDRVITQLP